MDIEKQVNLGVTTMPRLDLTGEVDLGQLRVINDDDLDFGRDGHFFSRRGESANSGQMAADLTAACEPDPAASGVGGGNDGAK
jgi:hypothetical protein